MNHELRTDRGEMAEDIYKKQTQDSERRDWHLWAITLVILLSLATFIILVYFYWSTPEESGRILDKYEINAFLFGFTGLVLLFCGYIVLKEMEIKRLRHTLIEKQARSVTLKSEIISEMNEELERKIEERSKELSQTQAQLFQTSKLATLGEMSAGLAHEMNQPLGGISLVAKHLRKLMGREALSREEIESGLRDIETSVKRMSKIIQHIRTFARQDTLSFIRVDANETIDSTLSLLGEQLRLYAIEVVLELDPALPKITGEPYQLEQVWINLIGNARDAMDEKEKQISDGKLQITDYKKRLNISTIHNSQSEMPSVEVSISDNGVGLNEEQKEKIFEPFFTTKEVGKATGLGLSISHGIVESHKGKIELESKEYEGTTVRVILPIGDK